MFGYQVCSSETAGIGDIYENTKGAALGIAPDKSNGGSTFNSMKKNIKKVQKSGPQLGGQQLMMQSKASANFAKEDDSILEQ